MAYWLVEGSNGGKLVKECETLEEAEALKAELIAKDPALDGVLRILTPGAPGGDPLRLPPP